MTTHSPSYRSILLSILLVAPLLALLAAPSLSVAHSSQCEQEDVAAAAEEAAGWPDYNPSDLANQVLQAEVAEEAQGWPNLDSTNLANQVRKMEQAKVEAAGWPDYDPSNIAITVALAPVANGPHEAAY